jgi:hypothetical protein
LKASDIGTIRKGFMLEPVRNGKRGGMFTSDVAVLAK